MPLRTIISMVHMPHPQSIILLGSAPQRHANETGFSEKHFVRRLAGDCVEGLLFEGDEMHPMEYGIIKHFEPIGKEYQKYDEWEKIDRKLSLILNSLL
jgi:hypothetical protein